MSWHRKGSKYGNKRCWVTLSGKIIEHSKKIHDLKEMRSEGCILFDSKKEAERFLILKMLLGAKEISNLELQPRFPIHIGATKVFTYVADFSYGCAGERIVEDVKSSYTAKDATYRLKRKCFEASYPQYVFREVI